MQLQIFNGNVAVPIDGRIGFGLPPIGDDEPLGPQILATDGDPNGVVTAPVGTIALDFTTPALWQNTDGGTTWVSVAMGAGVVPFLRTLYVNNGMAVVDPDGSIAKPFPTIQAALDAAGVPTGLLDQFLPYNIRIQTGVYDEDVTVPAYRSVNFIAEGGPVAVGDALGGPTPRNVTVSLTGVPFAPGIENRITFRSTMQQTFAITGSLVLSSDAGGGNPESLDVSLQNVSIQGGRGTAVPGNGVDATGFVGGGEVKITAAQAELFSNDSGDVGLAPIRGPSGPPGDPLNAVLVVQRLFQCRLEPDSPGPAPGTAIFAGSYGIIGQCQFDGDLTFVNDTTGIIDSSSGLTGFFDSGFGSSFGAITFQGVAAGDFRLDADTNSRFTLAGVVGNPSTKTLTSGDGFTTVYAPSIPIDWATATGTAALAAVVNGDTLTIPTSTPFVLTAAATQTSGALDFLNSVAAGSDIDAATSLVNAINDDANWAALAPPVARPVVANNDQGASATVTITALDSGLSGNFALAENTGGTTIVVVGMAGGLGIDGPAPATVQDALDRLARFVGPVTI